MPDESVIIEEKPFIEEYQGKPVLRLTKFFSFGVNKAKTVVKFFSYIEKFAQTDGKEIE
jgi:hypothetical protein